MSDKTWQKNAPSQIILNSIFAALVGILIVTAIQDSISNKFKFFELILLLVSFVLFALSAEQTLNALDEKDAKKYVYYMLWYNIGVILLGVSIGILIYAHFFERLVVFFSSNHPNLILNVFVLLFLALLWRWISDSWWLIHADKDEFQDYLAELEDEKLPKPFQSCLMKKFYRCRGIDLESHHQYLPHDGVYTRLKPSPLRGVGVFAIRDIPRETSIFSGDESEMIWIYKKDFENADPELKKLYDDFCVSKGKKYGCPKNFNMLTVGWYLNESKGNPNVRCTEDYDFFAMRNIKKGEELLVDYSTYSDSPK